MADTHCRVQCCNKQGDREFVELDGSGPKIRMDTPGALTQTWWSREQATRLLDALAVLIKEMQRAGW